VTQNKIFQTQALKHAANLQEALTPNLPSLNTFNFEFLTAKKYICAQQ
jgi:hypothetical protein